MRRSYLLALIALAIGLTVGRAQQSGAVSKPLRFRLPVEDYVRNYVEPRLETWLKWDRFEESTAQYQARTAEANQRLKTKEWEQEALANYKRKYAETINWKQFKIEGEYDPDNESVLIGSSQFGTFTLHVPRGQAARVFVNQFDSLKVSNPDFYFAGNEIQLDKLAFTLPTGESFQYDSKLPPEYSGVHIAYKPVPVDVTLEDNVLRPRPAITTSQETAATDGIDTDVPQTNRINKDIYAVIIGNENYFYESPTRFSANDAKVFKAYCTKTLGIPENNIFEKEDATYGDMLRSIQFLKNASEANNGNVRILFYYSGHGMADIKDNRMYLIPVDGSSMTLQAALKAEFLYRELSDMKPLSATVFLDACFSGKSSEGALVALMDGAGIEITPKEESLYGNLVVFSATSEAEIAYPYEEKQHRMFTYFLLKNLHDNKGDVTYQDLAGYIIKQVKSNAFDINRKPQTPKVQTSYDIRDSWKTWKIINN